MKSRFESLRDFNIILVVGPQRSGTRICAKMIAYDLGMQYISDEKWLEDANRHIPVLIGEQVAIIPKPLYYRDELWQFIAKHPEGSYVLHAPQVTHVCEIYPQIRRDTAIVFMKRKVEDIVNSEAHLLKDGKTWTERESYFWLFMYNQQEGVISQIRYEHWENIQKMRINPEQLLEIEYESLSDHPLWVSQETRKIARQEGTWNGNTIELPSTLSDIRGEPRRYTIEEYCKVLTNWLKEFGHSTDYVGWNILDVGCREFFTQHQFPGATVTGIDINENAKKYNPYVQMIDAHKMNKHFDPEYFDLIMCIHSLEHTYDIPLVLKHAHTLMKPGGILFFIIPMPVKKGGTDLSDVPSAEYLVTVCQTAGFKRIDSYTKHDKLDLTGFAISMFGLFEKEK